MPFVKNTFILSSGSGVVSKEEQRELLDWLSENRITYDLASNVISFSKEDELMLFMLRWT